MPTDFFGPRIYEKVSKMTPEAEYALAQKLCKDRARTRNRQVVKEYLAEHPCIGCGETDPMVLEFDHRDPTEKSYEISRLMPRASLKTLMEEIAKCDVRCANCHRRKSHIQCGGWRKSLSKTFSNALHDIVQKNFLKTIY